MELSRFTFLNIVKYTPLVSIDLIVRNLQHEVLLGLRNNEPAKNFWFVPGGRIFKRERISNAFQRIGKDELGIHAQSDMLDLSGSMNTCIRKISLDR